MTKCALAAATLLLLGCKDERSPVEQAAPRASAGDAASRARPHRGPCRIPGAPSPTLAETVRGGGADAPAPPPPGFTGAAFHGDAAYFLDAVGHAVVRQPKAGGAAERVADWDDDHGALVSGPGGLLRLDTQLSLLPDAKGPPRLLGDAASLMDAKLSGDRVFQLRSGQLSAHSLADQPRVVLTDALDQAMRLELTGDHAFVSSVGAISRVRIDAPGAPEQLVDLRGDVGYLLDATATHLYYATVGFSRQEIARVPLAGGEPEVVAYLGGEPIAMAVDDRSIYLVMPVDEPTNTQRELWQCEIATGAETMVIGGLIGWTTVAVDETHLAWTAGELGYLAPKDDVARALAVHSPPAAATGNPPDEPHFEATIGYRSGVSIEDACARAPTLGADTACRLDLGAPDEVDAVAPYQRILTGRRHAEGTGEDLLAIALAGRYHLVSLGRDGDVGLRRRNVSVTSIELRDVVPGGAPEILVRGTQADLVEWAKVDAGLTTQLLWVCGIGASARPSCAGVPVGFSYTPDPDDDDDDVRRWKVALTYRFDAAGRITRKLSGPWPADPRPGARFDPLERDDYVGTAAIYFP